MKTNSKGASASITRLDPAFIGEPVSPIKSKKNYEPCFRKLPFIAGPRTKSSAPCWHVPATGGYFGGYETGAAMAMALLKFLRATETDSPCSLPVIVESFMKRFEEEAGSEMSERRASEWSASYDSFRGQYSGFFNTLTPWLMASAKATGSTLDRVTEEDLVAQANAGLGFDSRAYMASLSD